MRFNNSGGFNAPFCLDTRHLLGKTAESIYTYLKVMRDTQKIIQAHDWEFRLADFRELLDLAGKGDFLYGDPPYLGRQTTYFGNRYTQVEEDALAEWTRNTEAVYCLSNWYSDRDRINPLVELYKHTTIIRIDFNYNMGNGKNDSPDMNDVQECLFVKPECAIVDRDIHDYFNV